MYFVLKHSGNSNEQALFGRKVYCIVNTCPLDSDLVIAGLTPFRQVAITFPLLYASRIGRGVELRVLMHFNFPKKDDLFFKSLSTFSLQIT